MNPTIELVVDADCPNVDATRRVLSRALSKAGLPGVWSERVQRGTGADATDLVSERYPSPTILIDGDEVGEPSRGRGCRIYRDSAGRMVGTPPLELVLRTLRETLDESGPSADR